MYKDNNKNVLCKILETKLNFGLKLYSNEDDPTFWRIRSLALAHTRTTRTLVFV